MLGGVSPEEWIDGARLRSDLGDSRVRRWLRQGLLVGRRGSKAGLREADDRYRQQHWHGLAAHLHARSRWHGEDAVQRSEEQTSELQSPKSNSYAVFCLKQK